MDIKSFLGAVEDALLNPYGKSEAKKGSPEQALLSISPVGVVDSIRRGVREARQQSKKDKKDRLEKSTRNVLKEAVQDMANREAEKRTELPYPEYSTEDAIAEKRTKLPYPEYSTEDAIAAEKRKIIPVGRIRSEEPTQLSSMERRKEAFTEQEIAEKRSAKEEAEFKDKFGIGYEDIPVTADVPKDDIRAMNQPTGNALSFEPVADEKTPSAPMGNVSTEIGEPEPVELDENRMAQLYRKTTGAEYNPEVSKAAREKMAQLKAFVSTNPEMLNKSDTRIALDFYKTLK